MVNPIYQQGEELLLNQFGSKYLGVAAHTNVNSNEFIVQEDAVISVLTGGYSSTAANNVDYKASMDLSDVTLKQGALIVAPQGESFQSMTIDSGTIMAYNSVVGGTKPSAASLLLDSYPDASAAYSLRKLRTDYTGPAIEARKTVAGTTSTQDIGFVNGELDTVLLLTFADGEDVFASKWYDQSGDGNDAAQVSESAQPKIVSLGSLITEGTKVAADFDGVDDSLIFTTVNPKSVFITKNVPASAGRAYLGSTVNTDIIGSDAANDKARIRSNNLNYTYVVDNDGYSLLTFNRDGTNTSVFVNSIASGTNPLNIAVDLSLNTIMQRQTLYLAGKIQEVIIYPSDQSANREAIEANINTHYTIY